MATTVVKQVLENGARNYIATYQILSDGSPLLAYVAADPTSSGDMGVVIAGQTLYPGVHLKIWALRYNLPGNVRITWEATAAQDAWALSGWGKQDFKKQGGLYVPQSSGAPITGATGKIDFNVVDPGAATTVGTIEMWLKKDIKQ